MTPDAALDSFAFAVGLRLMGPDARRRLHITLLRDPSNLPPPMSGVLKRIERLDALLDGRRQPETLQDRLDIARAERERTAAPFDPTFWLARSAELMRAGFTTQQAAALVEAVRSRVEPDPDTVPTLQEQTA